MTYYKIRDRETGLYSNGGVWPHWTTKGKMWSQLHHVKSHLANVRQERSSTYKGAELVTFEVIERETTPVTTILLDVVAKRVESEKKAQEAAERAKIAREEAELERLLANKQARILAIRKKLADE